MFNKFKEFFFGKPKVEAPEVPYKVEAPVANWPFPRASDFAPAPAPEVVTAPTRKPRAPARSKAVPAEKPVVLRKPRVKKTPAN
jgi:hypothetical protein